MCICAKVVTSMIPRMYAKPGTFQITLCCVYTRGRERARVVRARKNPPQTNKIEIHTENTFSHFSICFYHNNRTLVRFHPNPNSKLIFSQAERVKQPMSLIHFNSVWCVREMGDVVRALNYGFVNNPNMMQERDFFFFNQNQKHRVRIAKQQK